MKNIIFSFLLIYLALFVLPSGYSADLSTSELSTTSSSVNPANLSLPPLLSNQLNTGIVSVIPVDQAFALNVIIELPDFIVVTWEIEEGYYLYHHSLGFNETGSSKISAPIIPPGISTNDEFFGDSEVYYDNLMVRIPFDPENTSEIELIVDYQGCAEVGFCYPPQQRMVKLEIL